jgi:predicted AAA+ superfamily ATPase
MGLPSVLLRAAIRRPIYLRAKAKRRAAWYRDYIETLVQRDVRDLARIRALGSLPRLLQLACSILPYKIKVSLPDSGSIKMRKIAPIEKILEEIEALKVDIEESMN